MSKTANVLHQRVQKVSGVSQPQIHILWGYNLSYNRKKFIEIDHMKHCTQQYQRRIVNTHAWWACVLNRGGI